jgi:MFS family permease
MPASLLSIVHLLVATAFLEVGSGLQGVLIPIRAQLQEFSTRSIGLLGTAYYAGFVLGCVLAPPVLRRVGHIRAFSGFASLAAAAFLAHEFVVTVPVWLGLGVIIGFCFAGLAMTIESWLNDRATSENRGRILAAYMVTSWVAVIGGKLIFAWSDPSQFVPFALVSICICLSVVPVVSTTGVAPAPAPRSRLRVREILALSPVGLVRLFRCWSRQWRILVVSANLC